MEMEMKMKTLYVDTKNIIWHRQEFKVPNNYKLSDVINQIKNNELEPEHCTFLYETVEELTPDKNEGEPTIEISEDKINLLWSNA